MEQSHYIKADSFWASQEFSHFVWIAAFLYTLFTLFTTACHSFLCRARLIQLSLTQRILTCFCLLWLFLLTGLSLRLYLPMNLWAPVYITTPLYLISPPIIIVKCVRKPFPFLIRFKESFVGVYMVAVSQHSVRQDVSTELSILREFQWRKVNRDSIVTLHATKVYINLLILYLDAR
jgi:hypothetical protein